MAYKGVYGHELARDLARSLNSEEFELLLRFRTQQIAKSIESLGHSPSYTALSFNAGGAREKAGWSVSFGTSYSDTKKIEGELLSMCVEQCLQLHSMAAQNKLQQLSFDTAAADIPHPQPSSSSFSNTPSAIDAIDKKYLGG